MKFRQIGTALVVAFLLSAGASGSAQLLDSATWFKRHVGDGVAWKYYHFNDLFGAKQSISFMEIDLNNPNVGLELNYRDSYVGPSPGISSPDYPRAPTSTLAGEVAGARAAINGTYFNTSSYNATSPDTPWGGGVTYLKVNGTVVHTFDGSNINKFGQGLLFNDTNSVSILRKWGTWDSRASSWQNMMICGPVLLENGVLETYDSGNTHANARHPRSAVGMIGSSNKLILLTVDGRTGESAGMSCSELAQVMQALGCDNAMNLDGGGSTTLWASGEPFNGIVNYPSDNGAFDHMGERSAANAIVVVSNSPPAVPWDARMTGLSYNTVTRTNETVTVTAIYTNLGTETWTASNVTVVPSRQFGRTSVFVPAGQENTFYTMTPATVATGETATIELNLVAPQVATNTLFEENFALWHPTEGYFGPPDGELKIRTTVRPPLTGAPPILIVQGTATGPNNQWYTEGPTGWANSSVSFTADGVSNSGTQRYCAAAATGGYADFKPIFDAPGIYTVEAAFPASSNNITSVQYVVSHLDGSQTFSLNQNSSSLANAWQPLGQFAFSTEADGTMGVHSVRVINSTTTGNRFYSGAVRFDYVGPDPDRPIPVAPSGLTTSAPDHTKVELAWVDNAGNEDGFTIERKRDDEASFTTLATVAPDTTQYTDEGILPGYEYCYRIKAYNANGNSAYSNTACVTIPDRPRDELIGEVPNPGEAGDQFGYAIARMQIGKQPGFIIGAPGADDGVTTDAGRAYVYFPSVKTPELVLENPAPPPSLESSYFGHSVAAVGDSVLVGAPGPPASGNGGRVYMFSATTGGLQRTFISPEPVAGEQFGYSISAIGRSDVVIGAPASSTGNGRTYVFNLKKGTVVTLQDDDQGAGNSFGHSVAGGKGKVGVVSLKTVCSPGEVDIFKKNGSAFTTTGEAFSIVEAKGKFLVGAPNHLLCSATGPGYAYLLAGRGIKMMFSSPNQGIVDGFGYGVAGGQKFVGIGAALYNEPGADEAGRAYLFRVKENTPAATYINPAPGEGDRFGQAMAIAEKIRLPDGQKLNVIAVGAPFSDNHAPDAGAVYFYEMPLK